MRYLTKFYRSFWMLRLLSQIIISNPFVVLIFSCYTCPCRVFQTQQPSWSLSRRLHLWCYSLFVLFCSVCTAFPRDHFFLSIFASCTFCSFVSSSIDGALFSVCSTHAGFTAWALLLFITNKPHKPHHFLYARGFFFLFLTPRETNQTPHVDRSKLWSCIPT